MRPMRPLLVLVLACSTQAACVAHSTTMRDVRDALVHDDLEGARARLAEAGKGTDDLLFALEDGMLLHYLGDYGLSNQRSPRWRSRTSTRGASAAPSSRW